jgi:hypothetical protein
MENLSELITGVTVTYNTKDLAERAYTSVRLFHPEIKIIIVDGSEEKNDCYGYLQSVSNCITQVIHVGYNIGHGRGMCLGAYYVETPYILFFDSDIEMLKSPIRDMLKMFEADTFGVGYIEKTGFDGFEYGARIQHNKQDWMPYLHPYFQIVNVKNYRKYYPYVHHGAPCFLTMFDIYKKKLSNKILKEFKGLGHSAGAGWNWKGESREFIRHDIAGTRVVCKKKGKREIEGVWELNRGQV